MRTITLELIKQKVEYYSGMPDISVKSKKYKLPIYKGIYLKIALKLTDLNLSEVGEGIGMTRHAAQYWRNNIDLVLDHELEMKILYYQVYNDLYRLPRAISILRDEEIDEPASEILQKMTG